MSTSQSTSISRSQANEDAVAILASSPSMLAKIADFYEDEVDAALAALAVAIEPMLICFLGVAVLLIILGMFMPMIVLIQSLSGGDGTEKGASE